MRVPRLVAVVLIGSGLVLSACGREDGGGAAEEAAGDVAEGPATGTITVWAMGAEGEELGALAEGFEADNADATIQVTAIPWDAAHDKIAASIAGGETPDVTLVGSTWMGEFAETGALDPTPDVIDPDSFFEGAWETTVVDGTSYGVPWYVETRLLYYRTDLADQAGLEPPGTWDEFKEFVRGLQEAGASDGISLPPGGTGSWQTFMPFAWQNGVELSDGESWTLDTPEMTEALEYYASFFEEGLAPSTPTTSLESDFIDGRVGAFISGPWHMALLNDQGGPDFEGKYGVAPMPEEDSATSFVGGGDMVVFKDAENRDGAWKFVAYLSDPEVQSEFYGMVGALPSVREAWESGDLAEDPMLAMFGEQLDDAKSPPAVSTWEQVADVIDGEVEKVTVAGAGPAQAVDAMQSGAESIGMGG
jgi:multiple sugar transport system substrate-binding protein